MTRKLDYVSSVTNVERIAGEIVIRIPPVSPWPLVVVLLSLIGLFSTGIFIRAVASEHGFTFAPTGLLLLMILMLIAVTRYTLRKAKGPAVIRITRNQLICTAPSFVRDRRRTWSLQAVTHAEVAYYGTSDTKSLWLVVEDGKDEVMNAFYYRLSDLEAAAETINRSLDEIRATSSV